MLPVTGSLSLPAAVCAETAETVVRLDPSDASDHDFEGWGTSLCWWANRLGYSEKMTRQAADVFFSENGLGLDIARYNLGGGDDPTHNHITRSDSKVPGYATGMDADGNIIYDWTVDENQRNIAKAALVANPDLYFEGFSNSPPYFMTNSGCSSGAEDAGSDNLKTDQYDNFARFIAETTKRFKDEFGIEFKSYSPMNEPDTSYWGALSPKQEGCHYSPGESQSNMIIATRNALDAEGLTDVLVAGMDETSIDSTVSNLDKLTDEAKAALGRIDTHTYSGSKRAQLREKARGMNKTLWMSEVDGGWNGFGLADRIILDMNGMKPSAWVMWDIVDMHKDSTFQAPDGSYTEAGNSLSVTGSLWGVAMGNHDTEEIELSNKYYAFGQFTKYINPGDTIIASSDSTLAAYNKATGDIKIVVSNSSASDKAYSFDLSAFTSIGDKVTEIRSNNLTGNAAEHWAEITGETELSGNTLTATAKAATITTYIIEDEEETETALTSFSADADGLSYSYTVSGDIENADSYLAVYDSDNRLKYVSRNETAGTAEGDFTGCSPKLMVWDSQQKPLTDVITTVSEPVDKNVDYGVISGGSDELELNSVTSLTLNTSLSGSVTWSVSDESVASIDSDGTLTAKNLGTVTVYAEAGGYTFSRIYNIPFTGTIKGIGTELKCGVSASLSLEANITGDVKWSVSDAAVASITEDGVITGNEPGSVTIYASIGDYTVEKTIKVQLYTVTGTASWGNDSTRPADSADYLKAVDGDLSTYFDGIQNGWVQYDYGAPFKVSAVKLAARSGNGMPERTVGGAVQASSDGITWIDLYKITSAIPSDTYTTIASNQLADNHAYRYYRYTNSENMANIAEFILDGEVSDDTPEDAPLVKDIDEFTDNFEGGSNIFNADNGSLDSDGNKVFASGLDRYGNVFAPVKDTATAALDTPITLTSKDLFRITFTMFAGWENNGKDNTFAIRDKDGNEIAALYMTGGGYNFSEIRIGGANALGASTISQSRSNPGTSKAGANGWNASGQPYVNTVGYNKTVEITIDGAGVVSVSAAGGMEDTIVTGTLTAPVSIGSIELTGSYNTARERVVSYDNLDADVISYSTEFEEPVQTEAPQLPESGELISLSFDNGDLTSSSPYGTASGSPAFVTEDDKQCVQFDGTRATAITLTDANGNALLTGRENITISFKFKPTTTATSWWFFAAPNANTQSYTHEKYLGAMTNGGALTVERYNNNGTRSTAATGEYKTNEWNDVMISVNDDSTTVYVNGTETSTIASTVNISDMLGASSVAYIGLANWEEGEFATGYLDDFVIYNRPVENPLGVIDLGDTSAVTADIAIPSIENVTWETSDASVITADGKVTRADETQTAVLTAKTTENGIEFSKEFTITVMGKTAVLDTFAAYAENGTIYYTSDYDSDTTPYAIEVTLSSSDNSDVSASRQEGTASGSFGPVANGTYKVTCSLTSSGSVVKSVVRTVKAAEEQEMGAYLFAHFAGNESSPDHEQIYFSVSTDGTTWKTLNGGSPVLTSGVGEKGVRDPYILRGEDGKFYVIATDLSIYYLGISQGSNKWGYSQTNGSKSIVVWESDDLINWSEASLVKVAKDNAGCTWAPEAVYDADKGAYMVFWASKTADDNYTTQRMYRSYTTDFKTFTEPEIYIDGGTISNIDTTITSYKGVYYRFTKNESKSSVTLMKSTSLDGPWTDVETYTLDGVAGNGVTGYEGPTIYKLNGEDKWCLMLDAYASGKGYVPYVTNDITIGAFTKASGFTFDATYRHGTVIPITTEEYSKLTEAYPLAN